jgi:hypothetical protein
MNEATANPNGPYQEEVLYESLVGIFGEGKGKTSMTELRSSGGILSAFADDHDIQQITMSSTNIGFTRRYTKRYK